MYSSHYFHLIRPLTKWLQLLIVIECNWLGSAIKAREQGSSPRKKKKNAHRGKKTVINMSRNILNWQILAFNLCLIHLLVQIFFDHVKMYLTVFNIFWMYSNIFDHAQLCKFYKVKSCFWPWSKNLTVFKKYWTCSKKFERGNNIFWTSRWNRQWSCY